MNGTPVVVVGGYLGAGKTTLVNGLLRQANGRRIAVLVNDFGQTSIDADLIEGADQEVLVLAGGCVCCSFGADLVGTLQKALQRTPRPDVVLIECSGVGLPASVARTAALACGARIDGVVVVVDAGELLRQARDPYMGDTVRQQLQEADLLIVNQADRVAPGGFASLDTELARLAPDVPQLRCSHGQVPADLVLGLTPRPHGDDAGWLGRGNASPAAPQAAAERFRFFDQHVPAPVDAPALAADLSTQGQGLVRAKGVVRGMDGRNWLVQVMGRRSHVEQAPANWAGRVGVLACIATQTS